MNPNSQQQLIIDHFQGPCLVMAVPGSGKTASVTERTKKLVVDRRVDPRSILCITFTNKAANEMKLRIGKAVGGEAASKMTISTFHSLCARILRSNAELIGLTKNYTIYDDDQRERLLKSCIRKIEDAVELAIPEKDDNQPKLDLSDGEDENIVKHIGPFKPTKEYMRSLLGYIEGKRNACMTEQAAAQKYDLTGNQFKVATEYFDQLKKCGAIDYTGLLYETLNLFNQFPAVRDKYRDRFQYVSVDEVQDTNIVQYELIKHFGQSHGNVLVVGDLDQSIYKFRHANPENILQFEKDFPGCKVLMLETNYRSTPSILKHAQMLIENNKLRKGTNLKTNNPDTSAPRIIIGNTDMEMAGMIAEDVGKKISSGIKPKEIAILYRTNFASRVLEQALRTAQIKYKLIGGTSFWDRKEIKQCIAILKLKCNENDRMSMEAAIEACCKGVGEKAFHKIQEVALANGMTSLQAARAYSQTGTMSAKGLAPFIQILDSTQSILPGDALTQIAQQTAFWKRLDDDSTATNDRCANLSEMASDVNNYCSTGKNTLAGYLQNLSLITDADEDEDDEKLIKLMTLHGSKGLEFDVVYISHCTADLLPHTRLAIEARTEVELKQGIEEERRLLYVGMTRARKHLALYFFAFKMDARSKAPKPAFPSRFLFETGIPTGALAEYNYHAEIYDLPEIEEAHGNKTETENN